MLFGYSSEGTLKGSVFVNQKSSKLEPFEEAENPSVYKESVNEDLSGFSGQC